VAETVVVPDGNDQWTVSKVVSPRGGNELDDVVLVQSMLKIFLTSTAVIDDLPASDRAVVDQIFTSTLSSGGKFADGIYGANTRAAIGVLERKIGSPVKDGILRPIFDLDLMGRMSGLRGTKMRELNEFWDGSVISEAGGSKKNSGRQLLSPGLFATLYPDG